MHSRNVWIKLSTILIYSAIVAAILAISNAGLPAQVANKPGQEAVARKTTDPPGPAQGKLGQDLFLAVDHRDLAGVQSLIKQGADPNARNGLQFTPLYIAAASHQKDVVEALLSAGAKPDASSPYGTALTFAALGGFSEGINILLSHGANSNPSRVDGITVLMLACRAGDPEVVRELLRRKADVNAKDNDGATPLIYAAREGNVEVGRLLLLAEGAKADATDSHGWTALMYAAANGQVEFIRVLTAHGVAMNAKDAKGRTALMLAATYSDNPDVIRALIVSGADANTTDPAGRTASHLAEARGHNECVAALRPVTDKGPASIGDRKRTANEAVSASLKLIESSMLQFNKRTGCVSCHQEGLGRIVTADARDHGFRLNSTVEAPVAGRISGGVHALQPLHEQALKNAEIMKQVPLIEIEEVATAYGWLLAGMAANMQPAGDAESAMAMVLARQQLPDGHWQFAVPRVPMQSSFFTFTALGVRGLQAYAKKSHSDEVAERVGRAKTWLLTAPTKTSEDRAMRLLGLNWAGASVDETRKAADEVRADQRKDGGWAQLPNLHSDAYATGQALYALRSAGGMAVTDPVYAQGVKFLLRTQDDDGSWFVNKRAIPANNYFDTGFPHGQSQYASFNGTCWATMALLETIERPH